MRLRFALALFAGLAVACGGEAGEGSADAAADLAPSPDEAALDQIRVSYAEHYNLHHASVVADMYSDSAVALAFDGGIHMGKPAILANLETAMAGSPSLTLTSGGNMVFGDYAVSRGEYSVTSTPPGGTAATLAGNYLSFFTRENGAWKLSAVITNLNAPPPDGMPRGPQPGEAPPEDGTMKDFVANYTEHFNLGHANVVAGLYTEDAAVAFSGMPLAQGRAAIEAALTQRMAAGSPKVTIHDVSTTDLADGWKLDGGWYETTATPPTGTVTQSGTYMLLLRREADGSWKIHWAVTNALTTPAAG
jgi:uncharacterized protein (TIGR02246 family)